MKIDNIFPKKYNHLNKKIKVLVWIPKMMITLIFMDNLQIGNLKECLKSKNFVKKLIKTNLIYLSNAKIKD